MHLSKTMSYALRHHPDEFNLTIDSQGFVYLDDLAGALDVTIDDILDIVRTDSKGRYEIRGNRIRCRWGHSINVDIDSIEEIPPENLFHGTSHQAYESIKTQGLLPMSRTLVHLSEKYITAHSVGSRHDECPVVLLIHAQDAYESGIRFFHAPDTEMWFAQSIPPEFIEVIPTSPAMILDEESFN